MEVSFFSIVIFTVLLQHCNLLTICTFNIECRCSWLVLLEACEIYMKLRGLCEAFVKAQDFVACHLPCSLIKIISAFSSFE